MTEELSLNEYAKRLDIALAEGLDFSTFNRDMMHARIVVCTALEHAGDTVLLLSNKLDPDLYAGAWFKESARGFVDRGGRLDVLVESEIGDDHPLRHLEKEAADQVMINRIPDTVVGSYGFNFMVVDDNGYRFEEDRNEHKALVVFNRRTETHRRNIEALTNVFSTLKSAATG